MAGKDNRVLRNSKVIEVKSRQAELLAIFIPSDYSVIGIEFLTSASNSFQLGLMKRNSLTPSIPHSHNPLERKVIGTQEFLLVRKGVMSIIIFDKDNTECANLTLKSNDSVLLISGGHGITFSDDCELLELKQGPYIAAEDKIEIHLDGND